MRFAGGLDVRTVSCLNLNSPRGRLPESVDLLYVWHRYVRDLHRTTHVPHRSSLCRPQEVVCVTLIEIRWFVVILLTACTEVGGWGDDGGWRMNERC